jgi:hypothetical protein
MRLTAGQAARVDDGAMGEFFDFLSTALGAPTPKLFIVFGLLFLGVAVVGSITGRIQPGPLGRILGGILGPLLIVTGLTMEMRPLVATTARAAPPIVVTSVPTSVKSGGIKATPVPTPFRGTSRALDLVNR